MVSLDDVADVAGSLLQEPSGEATQSTPERDQSAYKSLTTFHLDKQRQYKQQFGDMYFLRLTMIKPAVEEIASAAFKDAVIANEKARRVERVLDVRQGELCYVTGTVYIDMPLKPNILDDVAKDKWISAPTSTQRYFSDDGRDAIMLEDESGRIRLVGGLLQTKLLVTGCIIAVMGTENANGEFEVIEVTFPDLAPQPERWQLSKPASSNGTKSTKKTVPSKDEDVEMGDGASRSGSKIAIVSGLNFSGSDTSYAAEMSLLLEYLLGQGLDSATQKELSHISRLIVAGNSIAADRKVQEDEPVEKKAHKKYGYDSSTYNPLPSQLLDRFLAELLPSMPVTLLPGAQDPANASFPQQPIHTAMFPKSRSFCSGPTSQEPSWFDAVTNPWEAEVDGWRVLGTSGQNIDDIFKYIDSDDRLGMMEATCRWRCSAPTAPDTLWSYPFQDDDPFVMKTCPHLYFIGCQPEFSTKTITGPDGQAVRLVTVPSFSSTKEVVLVDTETLQISTVKISAT